MRILRTQIRVQIPQNVPPAPTGFEDGINGSVGRQQGGKGLADFGPLESRLLEVGAALDVGRPMILAVELSMDRVIECILRIGGQDGVIKQRKGREAFTVG